MTKTSFTFPSTDNKTTIHAIRWAPESAPKAVLQIAHGMVEFIDRYNDFATHCADNGYLVVGHDHLGHGDSVLSKEEWGYIADTKSPDRTLVEDIHVLREQTQAEFSSLSYFMLGHSMGSYLLREYLALHGAGLTGAVVMGTGYISAGTTTLASILIKTMAAFRGWRHRSEAIRNMTYSAPYKRYDLIGKDQGNSWLTKDRGIVKAYYEEPRCTFLFTLNGYLALMNAVAFSCNPAHIAEIPHDLPILLTSGADDPVGDLGAGVRQVEKLMREAGIKQVDCTLYENDRHEILNETDRQTVYSDILAWLDSAVKTASEQ